jgi:hypothetical protein
VVLLSMPLHVEPGGEQLGRGALRRRSPDAAQREAVRR